jgi:hypothetical protein
MAQLVPIPYVHIGIGTLLVTVSIPLIFKLVPKNHFYGVRIPKALVSQANWYTINRFGGVVLLFCGLLLVFFGYATWNTPPSPDNPMAVVDLIVPLIVLLPAICLIVLYARTLPGE